MPCSPICPSVPALALLLAGCASVDPVTLVRLSALDPLTADPAGFEVALALPEGLGIARADLRLEAVRGGESAAGSYPLEEVPGAPPVWRVRPEALARLRADQARIAAWEAEDPEATSGSLSVDIGPCRIGAGPAPEATVDISIRVAPGGPMMPLVRGGPISEAADAQTVAQLPPCAGPG